ncbi:MAG TPA: hypothetical protein VFS21_19295 [Roseiflexaceae bacterium]|nr:hypothetical protein [Roseiflexaceae bacterium]
MPARQAALLRQQDKANKLVYRLRAGAQGSGKVLAAWPADTHGLDQAIAEAQSYGEQHDLEVVIQRAWLEQRTLRWMLDALVVTPDGVGEIVDYDIEEDRYLVLLDGEAEPRRYASDELRSGPTGLPQ